MKAVISTTTDSKYLFFLPITTWCWNKLGVEVVCFYPSAMFNNHLHSAALVSDYLTQMDMKFTGCLFNAPEHKEATYAQCARLYAGSLPMVSERDILITSDVDMLVFNLSSFRQSESGFNVFGVDLVPPAQYPMCYISGTGRDWRSLVEYGALGATPEALPEYRIKGYQQCLDELLGDVDSINMRGDYWAKDQEEAYKQISTHNPILIPRARPGTQFADHRLDRDDAYLLERLNTDIIDYHMPRPGWQHDAFDQIMKVIKFFYPNENLLWMLDYRDTYVKSLAKRAV